MKTLTLVYPDGNRFIVGGFSSDAALQAWLDEEQQKPYWMPGTVWEVETETVIENPPA